MARKLTLYSMTIIIIISVIMRMINMVNPWCVHELLPLLNGGHALNQVAHQSATLGIIVIIIIVVIIIIMIIIIMIIIVMITMRPGWKL